MLFRNLRALTPFLTRGIACYDYAPLLLVKGLHDTIARKQIRHGSRNPHTSHLFGTTSKATGRQVFPRKVGHSTRYGPVGSYLLQFESVAREFFYTQAWP